MTVNDMHEITFFWPRTDANYVVVTGTFDNWSKSVRLQRDLTGFSTCIKVPWNSTVAYKYIIDGKWTLDESKPRIIEPEGYVNNVYVVPSKPSTPALENTDATGNGSGATAGSTVTEEQHATLDNPLQGYPSGQKIATEAIMSPPVDRQQIDGEGVVMTDQNVPSPAENTMAEKEVDGLSDPAPRPLDLSTESSVGKTGDQVEGASTIPSTEGEVSQVVIDEPKRSIHLPLVPVNVPSEGAPNGSAVADEMASTHKPLGPVNKPSCSSSAAPESIPVTSPVPQGESAPTQLELKIPVTTYIPQGQVAEAAGTSAKSESKAVNGEIPAEESKGLKGNAESHTGEEARTPDLTQEAAPPNYKSASSGTAQPAGEVKPVESVVLPKYANGRVANGTSASRSSNATNSDAATFPRFSRESSDSRSSKFTPNGLPRKKRSSFLQKVKHLFSHDKSRK